MTQQSPASQFAGVARLRFAVVEAVDHTRISWKFRPVEAGYVNVSFTFLPGPTMNTERTVRVSAALGGIISYKFATVRSGSAIRGKFKAFPVTSSMSAAHALWSETLSTDNPMALHYAHPTPVLDQRLRQFSCAHWRKVSRMGE